MLFIVKVKSEEQTCLFHNLFQLFPWTDFFAGYFEKNGKLLQ